MLVLSMDCAGTGCGVGVLKDGNVLAERREPMERGQDQRLMPLVQDILQRAGIGFHDVDRIAVTRGPGSFTGLRIGLAAARGIGLAADKPVLGIDRFSIYHAPLAATNQPHLVVINSRRKELFCCFYPASGEGQEPTMLTPHDITAFLQSHPATLTTGDMTEAGFPNHQPLPEPEHIIAARLAAQADPNDPAFLPRPLYLRAPDVTMPKNGGLRLLTREDAERLAPLHAESFGAAAWSLEQIQGSLALDTTRGWAAFDGDAVVGFILCQILAGQSEVLTLCVRPPHRRRGVGAKLLHAAAKAAETACGDFYLEVAADNAAALALYDKLGFTRTGLRPNYYRHGNSTVDAVLLTRKPQAR